MSEPIPPSSATAESTSDITVYEQNEERDSLVITTEAWTSLSFVSEAAICEVQRVPSSIATSVNVASTASKPPSSKWTEVSGPDLIEMEPPILTQDSFVNIMELGFWGVAYAVAVVVSKSG
ncbi:hypothetical protein FI667_g3074, partial [Globisporangium splendens]